MPEARRGPIRVLLVDDHAVVRQGYRRLLELDGELAVVGEYAGAEAALAALVHEGVVADLLVLDLSMPGMSGLDLLRRLRQDHPALRVLVFTMHDAPALVQQALRAGAAGYITKNSEPQILVDALRRVAQGETGVLSPDVAEPAGPAAPHQELAPREFEVLQGLLQGLPLDEIAQRMQLSAKTVANYQSAIRQKLGVSSALELLRYAQRHSLPGV